jgi:hypothetical protein
LTCYIYFTAGFFDSCDCVGLKSEVIKELRGLVKHFYTLNSEAADALGLESSDSQYRPLDTPEAWKCSAKKSALREACCGDSSGVRSFSSKEDSIVEFGTQAEYKARTEYNKWEHCVVKIGPLIGYTIST